jgi:6-phosphogluconate dehydrogenase
VLDDVLDKVVQDDDNTEGTLVWSLMESAVRHVSCPTLATGHYLRIASGNREERLEVAQKLSVPKPKLVTAVEDREIVIENLRRAVYCAFLASFCQGLELISRASTDEGWNIDLGVCIQIWRAGCIIRSEYIADLLQPELTENKQLSNMKFINQVAEEFQQNYPALKEIVIEGTRSDLHLPAISSTLEYLKYVSGSMLPTQFMEAEMDYFGAHSYNLPGVRGEDPGPVAKGPHHYEWKPA